MKKKEQKSEREKRARLREDTLLEEDESPKKLAKNTSKNDDKHGTPRCSLGSLNNAKNSKKSGK